MTTLAVFDFDGTLFQGTSPLDFARFALTRAAFTARLLAFLPTYAWFRLGRLDHVAAKARFLRLFFAGRRMAELQRLAQAYAARVSGRLDPFHLERLAYHRAAGHRIVVLTASFRFIVEPWCRQMGLDLIATEVEVVGEEVTARLPAGNCFGEAKVEALRRVCALEACSLYAYGDSRSDLPLLRLADYPYYGGVLATGWPMLRREAAAP